jgi:putative spermidine/putrescine transport system substrate-binding protein
VRLPYRFALAGFAAMALLAAGCSSSSSSSSSGSTSTVNWATETSVAAGGGMNALVAAAKKEGTLNIIACPPTWANYGAIINTFQQKYGIHINDAIPDGTSQQEVDAVKSENGTAKAPDVLDIGASFALANTNLFAPYEVSTWSDIPTAQKEATGLWVEDYGGYMAIGYSSKYGTITSLSQLLGPQFKGAVALNGNPTSANAALNAVMMVNLAQGGTTENIANGVNWFAKLKSVGNFNPVSATGATIKAGTTQIVFNWDYLNLPSYVGVTNWKVFVPPGVDLGGYYAQAINKNAPHPAAARLWEEFLYSQTAAGGQNLWLQGGARPVEQQAMTSNASIDTAAAAKLPTITGTPVFLTQAQSTNAANYLAANWAKAVG